MTQAGQIRALSGIFAETLENRGSFTGMASFGEDMSPELALRTQWHRVKQHPGMLLDPLGSAMLTSK